MSAGLAADSVDTLKRAHFSPVNGPVGPARRSALPYLRCERLRVEGTERGATLSESLLSGSVHPVFIW